MSQQSEGSLPDVDVIHVIARLHRPNAYTVTTLTVVVAEHDICRRIDSEAIVLVDHSRVGNSDVGCADVWDTRELQAET